MEIKINKVKILKNIGIECVNEADYLEYVKQMIYDLSTHNKNYTKDQEWRILQIKEILDNMEVE